MKVIVGILLILNGFVMWACIKAGADFDNRVLPPNYNPTDIDQLI